MYVKIKALCDAKGISIALLEKECKLGNGAISKWAQSSPRIDNVQKVARYFDVPIEYFLAGEKEAG